MGSPTAWIKGQKLARVERLDRVDWRSEWGVEVRDNVDWRSETSKSGGLRQRDSEN